MFFYKASIYDWHSMQGYLGSILNGEGFEAGWPPCTAPILAGVMGLELTNPEKGLLHMLIYVIDSLFHF